ncbi:MAG: molecular chaperone [Pseudomonadota bacterium]
MKRLFFAALAAASLAIAPRSADAEVLIAPTRVVLEEGERSAQLVIVNKGEEEAAFRIGVENRRMRLDGALEAAENVREGEMFADDLIRYSPRRIVLEPGARQTVRVSVRPGSDMPDGEYRSHLRLMAVPTSVGRSLEQAAADTNSDELSIRLIAIRSLTIPIILRKGDLDAEAGLTGLEIRETESDDNESLLVARLTRTGSKSVYGDLLVYSGDQAQPMFQARGIAVYTPNAERDVILPIPEEIRDALSGTDVRVAYVSSDPTDSRVLAEFKTQLP